MQGDGSAVYVGRWADNIMKWAVVSLADQTAKEVRLLGLYSYIIAAPSADRVLYWAWPTEGDAVRFTARNSPLVGPKELLTVKVANPAAGTFETAIRGLDPPAKVSFGQLAKPEGVQ